MNEGENSGRSQSWCTFVSNTVIIIIALWSGVSTPSPQSPHFRKTLSPKKSGNRRRLPGKVEE